MKMRSKEIGKLIILYEMGFVNFPVCKEEKQKERRAGEMETKRRPC